MGEGRWDAARWSGQVMVLWSLCVRANAELKVNTELRGTDLVVLRMASRQLAAAAGRAAVVHGSTLSRNHLVALANCVHELDQVTAGVSHASNERSPGAAGVHSGF